MKYTLICVFQLRFVKYFSPIFAVETVADLERGRAGSSPPFGDGLTLSLAVMLVNAKFWISLL